MTSTNQPVANPHVKKHPPSRPGIKFMLCLAAAAIALVVVIVRS